MVSRASRARPRNFLYDFLVELLDFVEFRLGDIGDLVDRGQSFLHQDDRDFLVDIELGHEIFHQLARFAFGFLFGRGFVHDIQGPAGQLAGQLDILPTATDRLRQLLFRHRDIHRIGFLVDHDRSHLGRVTSR